MIIKIDSPEHTHFNSMCNDVINKCHSGGGGGDMEEDALTVSLLGWEKEQLDTDYVVLASTHITPSTRVARTSALEVDGDNGGIVVNSSLEAFRDLYVAGNLASYYDPSMGRRRRVDAYDHAVSVVCFAPGPGSSL